MKRFLYKLFLVLFPVSLIVVLINVYIDPANIFSEEKYYDGIVSIMKQKHNISNITNYDERILQKKVIEGLDSIPDLVVLGSSRVMEIGNNIYPGKFVINCGVSHANIYDLTAICGLLEKQNKLPHSILFNLDPFTISVEKLNEWESISDGYFYMAKLLNEPEQENNYFKFLENKKLLSTLSFSYFKESIASIIDHKNKKYYDAGCNKPYPNGRLYDGTISYPDSYTKKDTLLVDAQAKEYAIKHFSGDIDTKKLELLTKLVDYLLSKNVKLELIMIPFNPGFYHNTNIYHSNELIRYEKLYKTFAKEHKINIIGSFNAEKYGLTNSKFYDAFHASGEAIKKIF